MTPTYICTPQSVRAALRAQTSAHRFAPGLMLLAAFAVALAGLLFASQPAQAASGQVYSGTLQRCYKHPVTGVIEDSGGEKSYATGQGMVEGCLGSTCMMEETADGKCYLTIRLSLIDYTSKRSFKVQKWGAKGWSNTTYGVTNKGKNTDGTTYDYCIQVPAKNAIVRMTMYVTPMGRSVVCYFYAKNLKAGKPGNMKATIVTSAGKVKDSGTSDAAASEPSASKKQKSAAQSKQKEAASAASAGTAANAGSGSAAAADGGSGSSSASGDTTGAGVNSAQGLDLSTQSSSTGDSGSSSGGGNGGMDSGQLFATVMGAVVAGGVVLIIIAAIVVYYFRKHWAQWNPADSDNYEQDYRDSVQAAQAQGAPRASSAERAAASLKTMETADTPGVSADNATQVIQVDDAEIAADQPMQVIPRNVSDDPAAPDSAAADATRMLDEVDATMLETADLGESGADQVSGRSGASDRAGATGSASTDAAGQPAGVPGADKPPTTGPTGTTAMPPVDEGKDA